MYLCSTPDYIWFIVSTVSCVWVALVVHAAHARRYSSFWLGWYQGSTLRFLWAPRACLKEYEALCARRGY